jgi:predicted TIM-barrel fold metal-dependent hydrolase
MKLNDMILVSVDDHISEPEDVFSGQLSAEHLAKAPRLVRNTNGSTNWVWDYEGIRFPNVGLNAVVGRPKEEFGMEPANFEDMRQGCYDIHKRIDDMNAAGIVGSMCFPGFIGMDGDNFLRAKDKDNALRMLRAYNDWHLDAWAGAYPGRFIPLCMLPYWDMPATLAEISRVARKGCHAVSFSDNPSSKNLPSIHSDYWEPFWKACVDNKMVISCHIGTGHRPPHPSMESPIDAWIIGMPLSIAYAASDWLHLSALQRYPDLRVSFSEGGIGWVPYFLERADFTHDQHRAWTHADFGGRLPSEVFKQHFITCFIDDKFGLKNRHDIGVDMICYEMDYPHSDSVWPNVPERLLETFHGIPDDEINKMTHLNAMRLWHFDPLTVLGRENCTVGALRAQATHVNTAPMSRGGVRPTEQGSKARVTSSDVVKMFEVEGVRA